MEPSDDQIVSKWKNSRMINLLIDGLTYAYIFFTYLRALQNIRTYYMLNYQMSCTKWISYSVQYFVRKFGIYF